MVSSQHWIVFNHSTNPSDGPVLAMIFNTVIVLSDIPVSALHVSNNFTVASDVPVSVSDVTNAFTFESDVPVSISDVTNFYTFS